MEERRKYRRRPRGILGALVLITMGALFLMEKNGIIERHMLAQWWPLMLILIGGWLLVTRLARKSD